MPQDKNVKDLERLYTQAQQAKARMLPTWYMNYAYHSIEGGQWMAWDGRQLFKPKLKKSRILYEENRIKPAVRKELARMTKNRPVFVVTPNTADEEDNNAAELAEQLMKYLWTHLNLKKLTYKGLQWSRVVCAGFMKTIWDPSLGNGFDAVMGPDGPLSDGQGRAFHADQIGNIDEFAAGLGVPPGTIRKQTINQGDIRVEVRSPWQIFPDPLADTLEECEWLIEESVQSAERVRQTFGKKVQEDTAPNPGMIGSRAGSQSPQGGGGYKGARIREYWCKPNSEHPNGCRVVWCKDQELFRDEKPFDPMPYIMFSGIPEPGRIWPSSIVESLRPSQTELNKTLSQVAENQNRLGNPTIVASAQQIRDPESFADNVSAPGGIVWREEGYATPPVDHIPTPPLASYVTDRIPQLLEAFQDLSGQHEVTSAQVPPGVTAASAISLLQESDDTMLGPDIADYEEQIGSLGQKILKLAAHYYTDARTIRLSGDDGAWRIMDFRGSMLRNNTNVKVESGSAFPQNKAAKQAAMTDLMNMFVQSGNPPHGKQLAQFLEQFGIGGLDRLVEEYTTDDNQVKRKIAQMYQGVPAQADHNVDNSEAFVDGLRDEMKSRRFEQQSTQIKQLFYGLLQEHQQILASEQQAQMQLQMQMQGQPPPGQADQQGQMDLQGAAQQQQLQAAQGQQQLDLKGAQADQSYASSEQQRIQQQRHAEEAHQQKLRHQEEQHQANLRRSQSQQGGQRGR